jgi:hypothetical protein
MQKRARLRQEEWKWVQPLIPGKEPRLMRCASGPRKGTIYYVAETRLAGNERITSPMRGLELDIIEGTFRRSV